MKEMSGLGDNFKTQQWLVALVCVLFLVKLGAWYVTDSVSILTDALEYTINVLASLMGLYSLYLSSKPRDKNHPYGHGKIELLSAAVEGTLMLVSSIMIVFEAIHHLRHPGAVQGLDIGILLLFLTGVANYLLGSVAVRKGKANHSMALEATGKHMQSDTYASLGIVMGLVLMHFTGYWWIDSVVAFLFVVLIVVSGYRILRSSVAGIMDEADEELLAEIVQAIEAQKTENWVDLHNLRIIKYGSLLHLDCHLTVPWYYNIHEGHREIDRLEKIVKDQFGDRVELFVHTDGCLEYSCEICSKQDCNVRIHQFVKKIDWTVENISSNQKHRIDE